MIGTAFIEGAIWSVLWIIYVYVIVKFFPWQMLHDYPDDIQKAATLPEPTDAQKRKARIFEITGSLVIFLSLILFGLMQFASQKESFLMVFIFVFIIAMFWNVIDLIVMDIIFIECRILRFC